MRIPRITMRFLALEAETEKAYLFLSDRQGRHLDQEHMIKKMRDPI